MVQIDFLLREEQPAGGVAAFFDPIEAAASAGEALGDFAVSYGPIGVPALVAASCGFLALRYRHRLSVEARITGEDGSMTNLRRLRVPRGQKASRVHPGMPAVTVRRLGAKKALSRIGSTGGVWHYAGEDLDEPHVAILGRSGVGKNETLFDPAVLNAVFHRPGAVVINDVKGAVFGKFGRRISCPQYRYTFDPRHESSAALNLIATPEVARRTATALYPTKGEKVKIYNRLARALFLALAEHLGHGRSSIVELHRLASDRPRLEALAEEDPRVAGIVGGENKNLVGDVVSSLTAPLEPLEEGNVARVFASQGDQPDLSEKTVVWVIIPEGMEEDLGPLAAAVLRTLYERAKTVPEPVRFFVDEAGSCLALDDLARYLAVARGARVYFTLVLQDLSQLAAKIGWDNTRSVLGSAGAQYWGPTNDPETARYVSELSGMTEVARAVYEHHGLGRGWRQLFSGRGAPHEWRYHERAVLLPEHVTGCPKGWWYRYAGDPHRIELVIPTPMYEWPEKSLPEEARPRYRGVPPRAADPSRSTVGCRSVSASVTEPAKATRKGLKEVPGEDPGSPQTPASEPPPARTGNPEGVTEEGAARQRAQGSSGSPSCDGCGQGANETWSWCPQCGARL